MSSPEPPTSQVATSEQQSELPSPTPSEPDEQPINMYKIIMTPVNFVTFLFSLVLVDLRYTRFRIHEHSRGRSRLPTWLHDMLYRRQPYDDVGKRKAGAGREEWHYHSNQKKLMRMEAEEAFRLRGTVLILFAVVAATATGGTLYLVNRLVHDWFSWQLRR